MITNLKTYSAMKDSGVPWLGAVPEHWAIQRLRNLADMRVSNVDKHTQEGEQPVRLCNYVDVYKNDYIRPSTRLMRATATRDEVERFRLAVGDVLITKDSEAWNDIGVPALVRETAADLVSGYHLALLRPLTQRLSGAYLHRALQSASTQYQLHVEANGVTRYGLSHAAIKSVWLPVPPLPEQSAIVRFLDHADRRIRRYIRAKQKLIKLLEEQKQAIINRAVTRGLDPNVPLKPSGVEWLGDVPEHWRVLPNRAVFTEVKERDHPNADMLSVTITKGVIRQDAFLENSSKKDSSNQDKSAYKFVRRGDIAYNKMRAWQGAVGVSQYDGIVSPAYVVQRPRDGVAALYVHYLLRTPAFAKEAQRWSYGITSDMWSLRPEDFKMIYLCLPPLPEQGAIVRFLDEATASLTVATERARREVDLLREYRTRLIADVVTGKLDVREVAARLPDEVEEPDALDEIEAEGETEEASADETDEVPEEAEA